MNALSIATNAMGGEKIKPEKRNAKNTYNTAIRLFKYHTNNVKTDTS